MATHATPEHHARVAALTFAGVYPHYVAKVVKKGRSEAELLEVIQWLTGYTQADLESNAICSFKQEFEGNIEYEIWHCKEAGGISERLVFPRMENHTAKEFVLKLFYDKWNSWVSEFKYEPDGAGCYFEIEHSENQTAIDVYCCC